MRFSFLMITYNQENYILEALQSAVAQDYHDLEIIICDDTSKDKTFELAEKFAKDYQGPHTIILHRNPENLGIGANFQQAYELSSGQWLFMAAGDDIFMPQRCKMVAKAIQEYPDARVIATNYQVIDGNGVSQGYMCGEKPIAVGAALAWHRDVFARFPPIPKGTGVEDNILYPRVFFLGGQAIKTSDIGIKYRIDGHSFTGLRRDSALAVRQYFLRVNRIFQDIMRLRLNDLDYLAARQEVPFEDRLRKRQKWLLSCLKEEEQGHLAALDAIEGGFFSQLSYLFRSNPHFGQKEFKQRLRIVLASQRWLVALKRLIFGEPPVSGEFKDCRPEPPQTPTHVITVEDYLQNPSCDITGAAEEARFYRDDNGRLA